MTNRNTFDGLRFRIQEVLEQAKGAPLTATEIAHRLHAGEYRDQLLDTIHHKVVAAVHAMKDKGQLLIADARDKDGRLTYQLPRRMIFPPPENKPPANPVLTPEIAAKVAVAPPPEPKSPSRPYTYGLGDTIVRILDDAKKPLNVHEITKLVRAAGLKGNVSSSLNHLLSKKRIQARPPKRRTKDKMVRLEYFTGKTGSAAPVAKVRAQPKAKAPPAAAPGLFRPVKVELVIVPVTLKFTPERAAEIERAAAIYKVPMVDLCMQAIDYAMAHIDEERTNG